MNDVLEAALQYRARGFSVIPVKLGGKIPSAKWKAYQREPASEEQIQKWWPDGELCNIGIVTGSVSGLVVIDADSEEAAKHFKSLAPETDFHKVPTVRTGKGYHFYFMHPGFPIVGTPGILEKLDIRADGNQVVAPPSTHPNGETYYWLVPLGEKLPELPKKLLEIISAKPDAKVEGKIREGIRNDTLTSRAGLLRADGLEHDAILADLLKYNNQNCQPPLDEDEVEQIARSVSKYPASEGAADKNPWTKIITAREFIAQSDTAVKSIVKDLIVPGAITVISAPRNIGKTQVAHALLVTLAKGGVFRGERLTPMHVLLLDKDNPPEVTRDRLRRWGAEGNDNLHVFVGGEAPDLKHNHLWRKLPTDMFAVVVIDSWGAFTQGITEQEGRETTEILGTLRQLASKNIAVLVLSNTTKDGTKIKGRGEIEDRADIVYEVRDATGFIPSGKKTEWWRELNTKRDDNVLTQSAQRIDRIDYRLKFQATKYRLGKVPQPFCLELKLPEDGQWTIEDVTATLVNATEDAKHRVEELNAERIEKAAQALRAEIDRRHSLSVEPVKTKEAMIVLADNGLTQREAGRLLNEKNAKYWRRKKLTGGKGKGSPTGFYSLLESPDKQVYH